MKHEERVYEMVTVIFALLAIIAILVDLLIALRRRYFPIMSSQNDGF